MKITNYFIIPDFYTDFPSGIYSVNLERLFNSPDPLEFLRGLFKDDIHKFYSTRDELILRGISFKEEYQNNFFPPISISNYSKIIVHSNNNIYLNIDYKLLGLPNFIDKYDIQSDLFFNNLPIEGITFQTKNNTNEFVTNVFKNVGFNVNYESAKEPLDSEINNKSSSRKIREVFKSDFLAFHKFCKNNNYIYISDLSINKIEKFINQDQVGAGKVQKVIDKYINYLEVNNLNEDGGLKEPINNDIQYFISNDFQKYCKEFGIDYLEVVEKFFNEITFDELYYKKIEEFKEYFKDVVNTKIQDKNNILLENTIIQYTSPLYYSHLSHMSIAEVKKLVSIKVKITEWPIFDDDTLLKDVPLSFDNISLITDIANFNNRIKLIPQTINEIKGKLVERELLCLTLKSEQGQTLETIGTIIGVTRERVRQIIQKAENKIIGLTNDSDFSFLLKIYFKDRLGLSFNELSNLIGIENQEDETILHYMLNKNKEEIYYLDQLKIYTQKNTALNIEQQISTIDFSKAIIPVNELTILFNFKTAESISFEIDQKTLDSIMKSYKYQRKNDIYYKNSISLPEKITYLFKYHIKSAIRIDDEGYCILKNMMSEIFDDGFSSGRRAAEARIRDTENILLTDRLTFKYHDPYNFDISLMNHVEVYINNFLKNMEWVNVEKVYQANFNLMETHKIESKLHLYSLIQYYLSDNYDIGKGNTLNIYRSNSLKMNSEDVLEKLLMKNNNVMNKKNAIKELHWPDYKLDQLIGSSSKFMAIDSNNFLLVSSLNISETEKKLIIDYINTHLENGYMFPYEIFSNMQFDEQLNNILTKYKVTNFIVLSNLIKILIPTLKGHSNFLFNYNNSIDTLEKLLIHTFPQKTSRKELQNFILEKGYSAQTADGALRELLDTRTYIEIDSHSIVNRDAIEFNETTRNSLTEYLEFEYKNEIFLSVYTLIGYRSKLAPINIGIWTKHLIYNLSIELGYKPIKTTSDYRYDKLVLVKPNSSISNYEELVHHLLTNNYQGSMHESAVASYLAILGLAHNSDRVYMELKSSPLFTFDDFGRITLMGGINDEFK